MEYDEVVLGRRSIRGFRNDPVPRKVVRDVIELATRAPSSMNTQPWHLYVVTGKPLDDIRRENTERNLAGVPPFDCVAMAYPDDSFAANNVVSRRRSVEEVATFVGFADQEAAA